MILPSTSNRCNVRCDNSTLTIFLATAERREKLLVEVSPCRRRHPSAATVERKSTTLAPAGRSRMKPTNPMEPTTTNISGEIQQPKEPLDRSGAPSTRPLRTAMRGAMNRVSLARSNRGLTSLLLYEVQDPLQPTTRRNHLETSTMILVKDSPSRD